MAACGMNPSALVCWIAPVSPERDDALGVVCAVHADRLSAPIGWTLDDRRQTELQLFRPPMTSEPVRPVRVHVGRFDASDPADTPDPGEASDPADPSEQLTLPDPSEEWARHDPVEDDAPEPWDDSTPSWPPLGGFDPDDSILPDVSGPLMVRAFRGIDDRPAH